MARTALSKVVGLFMPMVNYIGRALPLNFEEIPMVPTVQMYQMGADTGDKSPTVWTPFTADGYPPCKTSFVRPTGAAVITEIPAGGVALAAKQGTIVVPATATLTVGGATIPAHATQDRMIPIVVPTSTTFSSGVTSSWFVGSGYTTSAMTVTGR